MTVATTTSRIGYTGNGATTVFSFPYPFFLSTDLQVYVGGVLKTLTTDYTVSGTAPYPSGANVTFLSAPANGAAIIIARVIPYTQTLDLVANDPLPADPVEQRLDGGVMMAQQLLDTLARSLFFPITDPTTLSGALQSYTARANKYLIFDASGNPVTTQTPGTWRGTWAAATAYNYGDLVKDGAAGANTTSYYYCIVSHTSGVWATDLAAVKWVLAVDLTGIVASVAAAAASAVSAAKRPTTTVSGSKTLAVADVDTYQRYTGAGGHTWTVPTNAAQAIAVDSEIDGFNATAFNLTITASSGVTVNGVTSPVTGATVPPYCGFNLKKNATNTWDYSGFGAEAWV